MDKTITNILTVIFVLLTIPAMAKCPDGQIEVKVQEEIAICTGEMYQLICPPDGGVCREHVMQNCQPVVGKRCLTKEEYETAKNNSMNGFYK